MLKIGITGGIGSGKSTVAKIVECLGFPVYYADDRAKVLTETNAEILIGIKALFGNEVFTGKQLNRAALARLVFANKSKLENLNQLIHPVVRQDYASWLAQQNTTMAFSEIAILFETGRYRDFDKSILVTAPEALKIARIKNRNGLSEIEIRSRMANQWSDEQKAALADFVIDNSETKGLIPQVVDIIAELKAS